MIDADCSQLLQPKSTKVSIINSYEQEGRGLEYYVFTTFFDYLKPKPECTLNCTLSETCGGEQFSKEVELSKTRYGIISAKNNVLEGYGPYNLCVQCISNTNDKFEKEFEVAQSQIDSQNFLYQSRKEPRVYNLTYNEDSSKTFSKNYTSFFVLNSKSQVNFDCHIQDYVKGSCIDFNNKT